MHQLSGARNRSQTVLPNNFDTLTSWTISIKALIYYSIRGWLEICLDIDAADGELAACVPTYTSCEQWDVVNDNSLIIGFYI